MKSEFLKMRLAYLLLFFVVGPLALTADHHGEVKALKHIVAVKFNDHVTSQQKDEAIRLIRSFATEIPEVKAIEGGENVTIEDAHKGFTHVFTLTFADQAGLRIYLPHAYHLATVEKLKPLFADVFVVDYYVY